ncbi:putative amidoligase enzyme-domain-containing protein [Sphaerosporella brunnea]|uniref:Putative amidoligase enzyme-domain-containing protein n=1 Tax=Sphaerosporella brunnea TaxID=1250544 RepID=A0A5J5EV61_9PEZI|nr:putative amidoligase enzyme-domain-containing protein [Sphaerosporella brunnea]
MDRSSDSQILSRHDLTFGIELEIVSSVNFHGVVHNPPAEYVREAALEMLREKANVMAQLIDTADENKDYVDDEEEADYTVWGVAFDHSIAYEPSHIKEQHRPEHPYLEVLGQGLLFSKPERFFTCHSGIEIISPVLKLIEKRKWRPEVERVLGAVTCDALRSTVVPSAGFHVHIGLGDKRFSLLQVKKIAAVCILAERLIDCFHAPHRRNDASMIQPMIAREVFADKTRAEIFDMLIGAEDLEALRTIVCKEEVALGESGSLCPTFSRYYKVNFQNVDEDSEKGTIEFRQHAGTLDPVEVKMWVQFTGLLVYHAANLNIPWLRKVLVGSATRTHMILPTTFMRAFIRNEEVERYYLAKLGIELAMPRREQHMEQVPPTAPSVNQNVPLRSR